MLCSESEFWHHIQTYLKNPAYQLLVAGFFLAINQSFRPSYSQYFSALTVLNLAHHTRNQTMYQPND